MRLTKSVIDGLKYSGKRNKQQIIWDDDMPGFGVRIYPSGKRAFVISYRSAGIKRIMTLGAYGVLTPDQGRKAAIVKLSEIVQGKDPMKERHANRSASTMEEICNAFMDLYSRKEKATWKEDDRRINTYIFPAWKTRQAKSIRLTEVMMLHHKIGERSPVDANRTVTLLGTIYRKAVQWQLIDNSFPNPTVGVKKFKEKSRDRWVTPEELPRLARAIESLENPYVSAAIWLMLFTGARKSEILSLQWENVNFFRNEIRLNKTKNGTDHYVPLSAPAVEILKGLSRLAGNPFVLPGHCSGRPLVNISKPWAQIRKSADLPDLRIHDLRRTLGSMLCQSGNSLHLIGRVLNHKSEKTTQIYARFAQNHVRNALETHAEDILKIAGSTESNATSFPKLLSEKTTG